MQTLYESYLKRESYFKEDSTKFEQFKNDTGLLSLDENQFAVALERLEDLLGVFDVAPEQVKEIGILITKLKDESLTDDEENYFFNLIGNYFKESYSLKRYVRKFKEVDSNPTGEDPNSANILLMPLVATFLKNAFLAKISVANQEDFERIKDQLVDKKSDIIKFVTDNPIEGISLVNSSLIDGLKDSSYVNPPTPDILPDKDHPEEEAKPLEDSDWFSKYASDEIKQSLASKIEDNKFKFDLSLPAPESNEEGLAGEGITDETPEGGETAPEIEGLDDVFGGETPPEAPAGGGGGAEVGGEIPPAEGEAPAEGTPPEGGEATPPPEEEAIEI